jgi:hypothetical protein
MSPRRIVKLGPKDPVWEEMIRSGDWSLQVWFLQPDAVRWLGAWGFSEAALRAAAEVLKKVYSPSVTHSLLGDSWEPSEQTSLDEVWRKEDEHQLAAGLFTSPGLVIPPLEILGLGVDLSLIMGSGFDHDLAERLRNVTAWAGADLEVQVWANCLRAGWSVTKIDGREERDQRRHDLLVTTQDGLSATVEVKNLDLGDDAVLVRRIHLGSIFSFECTGIPSDRQVDVCSADDLYEAAAAPVRHGWLKERLPQMAEAFQARLSDLAAMGYPFGEHEVAAMGRVVVHAAEEGFGGSLGLDLAGEKSPERQADRVVGPLWRAASKPRRDNLPSIAFIDLPRLDESLVVKVVERDIARRPSCYQNLDGFVYRTIRQVSQEGGRPFQEWRAWAKRLPWAVISIEDLDRLALGMIRSPHRLAMPKSMVQTAESTQNVAAQRPTAGGDREDEHGEHSHSPNEPR